MGIDHGWLFQESDRTRRRSDQLDYDYFADRPDELARYEMAFARPLRDVLPRLAMRGYSIESARGAYDAAIAELLEFDTSTADEGDPPRPTPPSFEEFCAFVAAHPVRDLDGTYLENDDDRRAKVKAYFAEDQALIARFPRGEAGLYDWSAYSVKSYFGGLVGILDSYSLLCVFGLNEANRNCEVVWQYGPLCENGWTDPDSFQPLADRRQTVLIATEGSSDARILAHALKLLRPDILDFFRFIDLTEGHPFAGVGNLVKFAQGLVAIDVQNKLLLVLDNDAEGVDGYQKISALRLPANMGVMVLPDLEAFRSFPARGPEGVVASDINGRAAAIECYLDLDFSGKPPAAVTWTNYKKDVDRYQGSLDFKTTYVEDFLRQTPATIAEGRYDVSKMKAVLDAVFEACQPLAL